LAAIPLIIEILKDAVPQQTHVIDATQRAMSGAFPVPSIGLFLGLQILDVLTTLIGLHLGAQEGSTFIGQLLRTGPLNGLIISKIIAAGLAAFAVFLNRKRLLVFLNFWFAAVVVWNLIAICLQLIAR
jgi:hypothetical protein